VKLCDSENREQASEIGKAGTKGTRDQENRKQETGNRRAGVRNYKNGGDREECVREVS
jgi:hypothetical protein